MATADGLMESALVSRVRDEWMRGVRGDGMRDLDLIDLEIHMNNFAMK